MTEAPTATTWSAPGRVNLIGEHLDYNGGPVLPFALDLRATVTISTRSDGRTLATSEGFGTSEVPSGRRPGDATDWVRYVAAAVAAFEDATGAELPGLDIAISSTVPPGAGLSSSAALECALLCALDDLSGTDLGRRRIAALATTAEQDYVGVPCGPMDHLVAMLGEAGHALLVDTSTLAVDPVPMRFADAGLDLLVIDTRVRHSLDDGAYADRRAACTAAATALDLSHLTDATLPQAQALQDPTLSRVARHVVTETRRVHETVELMRTDRLREIGPLLTESHHSLAADFQVSCTELDLAVDAALAGGALGARMTGGGFGGSAIALCARADTATVVDSVQRRFTAADLAKPPIWHAEAAGAAARAHLTS